LFPEARTAAAQTGGVLTYGARAAAGQFAGFGDFMSAVHSGLADTRLHAAAGSSAGVGADGGFLVPTEFAANLFDASLENEIVRPRAIVRPMTTGSVMVAGFDTQNHSGSIGGFTGQWLGEGATMTMQKGLIRNLTLTAKKLGILTAATNELVADSPYFEQELARMLAAAIGWHMDLAFLTGTGAGQPLGVINDPALITVAKEVGQPADTIVWQNLKKMYARLHPASLNNAVWIASNTAKVQLLSLVQPVTNVAGTENVGGTWIPALRDDGSGAFTLLGVPVVFTEKLPVVGDLGDIVLADLSQYAIGLRAEMSIQKSMHVGFDSDESYYRLIVRADGMGRWSKPVTPKAGDTLSWCVALAARA